MYVLYKMREKYLKYENFTQLFAWHQKYFKMKAFKYQTDKEVNFALRKINLMDHHLSFFLRQVNLK